MRVDLSAFTFTKAELDAADAQWKLLRWWRGFADAWWHIGALAAYDAVRAAGAYGP